MAVDFSRENLSSLTRDGISEELFKLLWAKDELNFSPTINIPDTILYKYGQPVTWYFTSTDGRIKRKNKHNLVSAKIEQAFNKHILGYDVIAYFISMPSELDMHRHQEIPTVIEYFDRTALNNFLYNHKKDVNGVLQRFIEPKTTHNEVIRAIWSPKLCLLERAENKHALHDNRYGLYERTVVYEGPEYYYTSEPLRGPVLSGQIQKQCEAIVAHVGEVTFGQKQISRVVLNFKVDSRDKIWFLYSTSIRSIDMLEYNPLSGGDTLRRSLVNIDSVVSLADTVHLNPKKTYDKIVPKSLKTCLSCAKETLEDTRHPVTYKQIMKHYEHVLLILQSSSSALHSSKKDGTIIWPPDPEVLQATGNVGFGCMQLDNDEDFRPNTSSSSSHRHTSQSAPSTAHGGGHRRTMTIKHKKVRDVLIPPVLAYLHTRLTPETFERCKSDPLFQNKTVMVCEDCYLVYAEFATMMLRMGENLKKLLLPDARQLDASSSMLSGGPSSAGTLKRPSSADWRAISTAALSTAQGSQDGGLHGVSRGGTRGDTRAMRHEQQARERAIGLRTSDTRQQPALPSMVRSASESASLTQSQHVPAWALHTAPAGGGRHSPVPFHGGRLEQDSLLSTAQLPQSTPHAATMTHTFSAADTAASAPDTASPDAKSFTYDANAVHSLIAERERQFFKEISLNPQLRDHHPLQHMLHAQQKLKLVDEQSGVLMNKAAQQSESIFGTRYGRQGQDQHDRYTMYATEVPYALHGEIILPSQLKVRTHQRLQAKKRKKQEALQRFLEQQRREEEAQLEQLHRQQQEKDAVAKALAAASSSKASLASSSAKKAAAVDPAVVSSQHYRDFLKDSLQKIGGDMADAQAASQSAAVQQARRDLAASEKAAPGSASQRGYSRPAQPSTTSSSRGGGGGGGGSSVGGPTSPSPSSQPLQRTMSTASAASAVSAMSASTAASQASSAASPTTKGSVVSTGSAAKKTTAKKAPTSAAAAALPSAKYQSGLATPQRTDDASVVSANIAAPVPAPTPSGDATEAAPLVVFDDEAAARAAAADAEANAVAAQTTTTAAAGFAGGDADDDGVSFAGSLSSQVAAPVDAAAPLAVDTAIADDAAPDAALLTEDGSLLPGGLRDERDDDGAGDADGDGDGDGDVGGALDQLSVDQSSLGQSVVDLDAAAAAANSSQTLDSASLTQRSLHTNSNPPTATLGGGASLTAENSIVSGASSMRQQTDALLQLAAEAASATLPPLGDEIAPAADVAVAAAPTADEA